jgi:hypothetical protein
MEAKMKTGGNEFYPVNVAQIKDISPCLKPLAFCANADKPRVYSNFTIDSTSAEVWFYAPVVDRDQKEIAASVIEALDG